MLAFNINLSTQLGFIILDKHTSFLYIKNNDDDDIFFSIGGVSFYTIRPNGQIYLKNISLKEFYLKCESSANISIVVDSNSFSINYTNLNVDPIDWNWGSTDVTFIELIYPFYLYD